MLSPFEPGKARYLRPDDFNGRIDFFLSRYHAQRDADRLPGAGGRYSLADQYAAGPMGMGRAGRARRYKNPLPLKGMEQHLAADPLKGKVHNMRGAGFRIRPVYPYIV